MKVNEKATSKAKEMIRAHHYVLESDWSKAQASTDEENDYLENHSWQEYGEWFLAIDTDAGEQTKDRYNFPYGDFQRVHRSGLKAAKQRAAQYDYPNVEKAAGDLLELLDESKAD